MFKVSRNSDEATADASICDVANVVFLLLLRPVSSQDVAQHAASEASGELEALRGRKTLQATADALNSMARNRGTKKKPNFTLSLHPSC